jgi:hypothetical protein
MHEMLIFDCYQLIAEKKYCYCILNLAQAYEVFFSLYLRVQLIYRPFARKRRESPESSDLDRLNKLMLKLYTTVEKFGFENLRNVFLGQVIASPDIATFDEASRAIENLPNLRKAPCDHLLDQYQDKVIANLLKRLKDTKINQLRNEVVHKRGFRPTLEEVESALDETRAIIFPLGSRLGIADDDPNSYLAQR